MYGIPVLQMIYSASFIIRKHKPWKRVIQLPATTSDVDEQCHAGLTAHKASMDTSREIFKPIRRFTIPIGDTIYVELLKEATPL